MQWCPGVQGVQLRATSALKEPGRQGVGWAATLGQA